MSFYCNNDNKTHVTKHSKHLSIVIKNASNWDKTEEDNDTIVNIM